MPDNGSEWQQGLRSEEVTESWVKVGVTRHCDKSLSYKFKIDGVKVHAEAWKAQQGE